VTQEQFGTEGDRVNVVQRSLRRVKSEQKKMKEAQEEPELPHELENLRQVLGVTEDVRDASTHSRNTAVTARESHGRESGV
jgi:hypothetical protein